MKRTSILKRGNGFKKVVGNSLKRTSTLKKSGFKRTLTKQQSDLMKADSKFAREIKQRDGRCLNCGSTKMLSCSHFYGRSNYATRFDPDNCVTFCIPCHDFFESKKTTIYLYWMVSYLGPIAFYNLEQISKHRVSKQEALEEFNNVEHNNDIQY